MGVLVSLIAAFFGTSKDLVSKRLAFNVSGGLSAFASFFFAIPFYLVALLVAYLAGWETFAFSYQFALLVVLRSLTDALAEVTKMEAMTRADVSVVSCLLASTPVFLLFWSPIITGDNLSPMGVAGVLVVVAGNLIVLFPARNQVFSPALKKGVLLALCSAFFFSLNTCFDRLAVKVASPLLSSFMMTLLACVLLSPVLLKKRQAFQQLSHNKKPFFIRGFFEITFMVTKLAALQFMQAPYVAALMQFSLIFSIIGGKLFFKEKQVFKKLVAGAFILTGCIMIALLQF